MDPNWEERERGTLAHEQLVLQLTQLLASKGHLPRYGVPELNFDLSWTDGPTVNVVEIKSLSGTNQAHQIRLGLGQVLDYRWSYLRRRPSATVRAALVVEAEPADLKWRQVCAHADVLLTWPERMVQDLEL